MKQWNIATARETSSDLRTVLNRVENTSCTVYQILPWTDRVDMRGHFYTVECWDVIYWLDRTEAK